MSDHPLPDACPHCDAPLRPDGSERFGCDSYMDEDVVIRSPSCLHEGERRLRARVAELEAALAASVPREVAKRACRIAARTIEVFTHPEHVGHLEETLFAAANERDDRWMVTSDLALARAEAEASAARTNTGQRPTWIPE